MQQSASLVLEVIRQENSLAMAVFEQGELSPTLKHYSQLRISNDQISRFCEEIISIVNKATIRPSGELSRGLEKAGQLLWDHLLTSQVKDRLSAAQAKSLLFSLDEELIDIPWELLFDGRDFLCLKFNLGRLVRTRQQMRVLQYRSASSVLKMLILADPTGDLKSAYREGAGLKEQFMRKAREIRIDFKSSNIDTLYVKKNLRDYDIVHFAGHCEYEQSELENSGWLLSDGRFTTKDILRLSESLTLPSVVFSNACHSYSLASAFLFSGVRHYIGTIWRVEDQASLKFSTEFYQQLLRGKPIGECIRLGRLKLAKEYGISSLSWTSYILYGDPGFVLFKRIRPALSVSGIKKKLVLNKKLLKRFLALKLAIFIIAALYIVLPAKHPEAYLLFSKANKSFKAGKNSEVISLARDIAKIDPLFLAAYRLAAGAYQRLGNKQKSLENYFIFAFYSQKKKDLKSLSAAYIDIAWTNHLFDDYERAFDFYNKAISLAKENKDKLHEAIGLRKLAVWYIDKGDNDKALELLTKSSEINRPRQHFYEHRYNLACDYFDLGLVFTNKDDFTAAREFYAKSRGLFEKMRLKDELSDYYFNLGELYLFDKQYNKALENYLLGLKIDEKQGNLLNLVSDYEMIRDLYLEMGNLEQAEVFSLRENKIRASLEK